MDEKYIQNELPFELLQLSIQELESKSIEILETVIQSTKTKRVYALFSGGYDSLVSTYLTSKIKNFSGVIHIDTGIGIPETQKYVIEVCDRFNWDLIIAKAKEVEKADGTPNPQIYEEFVKKYGFPGASQHSAMYQRLKEKPLMTALRKIKKQIPDWNSRKDKIILSTGIRLSESRRRSTNTRYQTDWYKQGAQIWISPIRNWTKDSCEEYMSFHDLPRNPVKDNICMSGDCCCGAFAKKNELIQIEFFYPEMGKRIRQLEEEVCSNHPWGWEDSPSKSKKSNQTNLDQPMCYSCNQNQLPLDL